MKQITQTVSRPRLDLTAILASRGFFMATIVLLIVQATWIAFTSHYPMAFDEDFHLGIIRIYAHHLSPFLTSQPAGAYVYGAVARDPSYLYQYLMSFPYRLISVFTQDQTIQVLCLRVINIGLFVGSLILYRRLLLAVRAPLAAVQGSLFLFILIPVVPLLAAQINYDNLFLPVVALSLLIAVRISRELREHKRLSVLSMLVLASVCLLGSLVKYPFLPVFAAIVAFLVVEIILGVRSNQTTLKQLLKTSFANTRRSQLILLSIVCVLSFGLFMQRYGVNLVRYHEPVANCSQVLSVKECSNYGPWIRDYDFSINKVSNTRGPIIFTGDWFYGMWLRLYFAVDGPGTGFQSRGPLPVPALSAIVIAGASAIVFVLGIRKLFRKPETPALLLIGSAALLYVSALWFDDYKAYLRTGQPVAINGRYLLPFIPIAFIVVTQAYHHNSYLQKRYITSVLVTVVFVSQLYGGGVLTYILRSNDAWYWPNQAAHTLNHAVQKTLGPVTPGYKKPTEFLH